MGFGFALNVDQPISLVLEDIEDPVVSSAAKDSFVIGTLAKLY